MPVPGGAVAIAAAVATKGNSVVAFATGRLRRPKIERADLYEIATGVPQTLHVSGFATRSDMTTWRGHTALETTLSTDAGRTAVRVVVMDREVVVFVVASPSHADGVLEVLSSIGLTRFDCVLDHISGDAFS